LTVSPFSHQTQFYTLSRPQNAGTQVGPEKITISTVDTDGQFTSMS